MLVEFILPKLSKHQNLHVISVGSPKFKYYCTILEYLYKNLNMNIWDEISHYKEFQDVLYGKLVALVYMYHIYVLHSYIHAYIAGYICNTT